jgi:hypothetical protein
VSSSKDFKPFLELLRRDNRLPVTAQRPGSDALLYVHNPASIRPIVKDVRYRVVVNFALAIGFYFDEWTPGAIVIAASVKFLGDVFESEFISKEQIPRQSPDLGAARI